MSAWDRKAVLEKYERRFDASADPEALLEELGTPTKVAVELAKDYVPSPPPEQELYQPPRILETPADWDGSEPEEAQNAAPAVPQKWDNRRISAGGVIVFCLLTLIVGIPVGVVLICVGLPFLALGVGLIAALALTIFETLGRFNLMSDKLAVLGCGCALAALGLVIAWFGLWLSITLCRLWIGKVLTPLARRMCVREE